LQWQHVFPATRTLLGSQADRRSRDYLHESKSNAL
jgi:hypothetical protein